MPKFNVTVSFDLGTTIEPDLSSYAIEQMVDNGQDVSDESSLEEKEITVSGGEVRFVVEADDEADAQEKGESEISEGMEITDDNNLTWVFENISVEVEQIEMSKDEAIEIVQRLLDGWNNLSDVQKEAIGVLLRAI